MTPGSSDTADSILANEQLLRAMLLAAGIVAASASRGADLDQLASIAVPALGDYCVIDVIDPDGQLDRCASAAVNPDDEATIRELRERYPPRRGGRHMTVEVIETREPLILRDASPEALGPRLVDEGHRELVERLHTAWSVTVPLLAGDVALGAMNFVTSDRGRGFKPAVVAPMLEYGKLVAAAITAERLGDRLRARSRASEVIDRLTDGVVALDPAGRVLLWNPAVAQVTGVVEADAVGRRIGTIVPSWTSEVTEGVTAAGRTVLLPVEISAGSEQRGSRPRWLAVSGVCWVDGSAFVLRDVTAERELERVRDEIIATVSHQLRTPLASVYAAAITLARSDIELDDGTRAALLDIILEQSQRLDAVASDLLLTERIDDAGASGSLQYEHVDFVEVLEDIVAATRLPEGAGHELTVDAPTSVPAHVPVDAVVQVCANLLDNAVKYSPEGGRITVAVSVDASDVELTVCDVGIGIADEHIDRIFERFYRADPDMLQGVGGSGIGLHVVRRLVQLMGGTVRAERLDRGTCFRVTLPGVAAGSAHG